MLHVSQEGKQTHITGAGEGLLGLPPGPLFPGSGRWGLSWECPLIFLLSRRGAAKGGDPETKSSL